MSDVPDGPTLDELREILAGIDLTEGYDGWWETAGGAEFGADVLDKVLTWGQRALGEPVTNNHIHQWTNHSYTEPESPTPYRCRCGVEEASRPE